MALTLVGCGDSWAWGTELIDPTTIDGPDWDFNLHHKPINKQYREDHRYLKLFADKIEATSIVDLSQGGCSNDTIVRKLVRWLTDTDYMSGRDPSDLFISIGWTSPERKDFCYKQQKKGWEDGWVTLYPMWAFDGGNVPGIREMGELYAEYFWSHHEYMNRWINQIWQIEFLLKNLNIKYVMHQAFYQHHLKIIKHWNDGIYRKNNIDRLNKSDLKLWNTIDPIRFMEKENTEYGTFHNYILNIVGKDNYKQVISVSHPNELGHKIWADYMYTYCTKNNLL
jgi:hypothetical protein